MRIDNGPAYKFSSRSGVLQEMTASCRLSADELAACFTFLPFRDRISASQVSRYWRSAALSCPAVWADITIKRCANPLQILELSVARAGQLAISLSYLPGQETPDPELYAAMEGYFPRFQSIVWGCSTDGEPFDVVAPLLESFETSAPARIPKNPFIGHPSRIRRLHVGDLYLPLSCPALSTLVDLKAKIPTEPSEAIRFRALFDMCPRLESLELEYVQHAPENVLPPGPAPLSLTRLALHSFRRTNLAKVFLDWRTRNLKDVLFTITNPTSADDAHFMTGAHELSLLFEEEDERSVNIATYPDGSRHTLVYPNLLREDAVPEGTQVIRDTHVMFSTVRTLKVSLSIIYNWISHAPWPRQLQHLTIVVQEEAWITPSTPRLFPWYCLGCMASFHALFPELATLTLVVRTWRNERQLTLENAHHLLETLTELNLSSLPDVRVRGFSEDVVRAIDRHAPRVKFLI